MPRWLLVIAGCAISATAWWLALVYHQTYTLAATGAAAAYVIPATWMLGWKRLTTSKPILALSAVPLAICAGAGTVALVWLLALI